MSSPETIPTGTKIREVYYSTLGEVIGEVVIGGRRIVDPQGSVLYEVEFDGVRTTMFDTEFKVVTNEEEEVSK
jgi:hypothetical protein